ncbi:MAG: winged helix-turn-helix transcriptional regulator [Ruminococcaceae bacterium]|nr:winged helix-turn-helix transcriptional regulator [Oscillospiraceae bacterium]
MNTEKILMSEVATLYYKENLTQQEIAETLHLSRQTVSKLLSDAIEEKIVEIIIHDPPKDCKELEEQICAIFGIRDCVVCSVSGRNESVHRLMTVKAAVEYILPIVQKGNQKIALSWGRTIQELIQNLPKLSTAGNTVFPLFGATDTEHSYFSSNELARKMADKLDATPKCAWFPYLADSDEDSVLLKQLGYYKRMQDMWNTADLAILGIGNTEILDIFGKTFGYSDIHCQAIGDIATHFFDQNGTFVNLYSNTLCASVDNIKNARESVAIACGKEKAEAIAGALRTKMIDTLITDEYTARRVLEHS